MLNNYIVILLYVCADCCKEYSENLNTKITFEINQILFLGNLIISLNSSTDYYYT